MKKVKTNSVVRHTPPLEAKFSPLFQLYFLITIQAEVDESLH